MDKHETPAKKHCCEEMASHLDSLAPNLIYIGKFREYGIKIPDGGSSFQQIDFCPWCGGHLPKSLRDEWFDIVFEKLELDGPDDPSLPVDMKTEDWWIKRLPQ